MTNKELLDSFVAYCKNNPDQRFWQALRNWADLDFVYGSMNGMPIEDTFNWEKKNELI